DGYLIVVTPATDHLYAMREALFEQVNPHTPQKFVEQLQDLFELKEQQVIDAPLVLDQQALKNLIAMTPYAYKASPERRMQLEQKAHLQVTASFQIYLFQKRNKKAI
ncbi:TPA: methyltransferase, partial [Acinetobacter baumannii]|nr:methyltransferase [Acinetobacter baumannii]HCW4964800.1 methyltransferase [Acinetobacter baumannii]